ncbi:hypothetical protein SDJN03_29426, partial [Cucurbita argyrosperma subsp. sororia]
MFLVEPIPEPRYIKDENLLDKASNLRNLNFKISFSERVWLANHGKGSIKVYSTRAWEDHWLFDMKLWRGQIFAAEW